MASWDTIVLGVNCNGDPDLARASAYPVYPAWPGGDPLGIGRLKELCTKHRPDLIVLQTNPWHAPVYQISLHRLGFGNIPVVGIIAVEGKNCVGEQLNRLQRAVFWTTFGQREAALGGMTIPSCVVPLGVDTEYYTPGDRTAAREMLGLGAVPLDAFIVGNVNRNQNRKRLDLSIIFFAEWIHEKKIRDAYLYLHVLPGSGTRINLQQLATYMGCVDRLILAEPKDVFHGAPEKFVRAGYQAFDVGLTTTLGEGMGLTTLEGMACGIPQIAGDYAAIGEWGRNAVYLVNCNSEGVMPDVNNMIGSAPDKTEVIEALDLFYRDHHAREVYGNSCLARARELQFNWDHVASAFADAFEGVVS